ncbi:MAG: Rieske (2Fe-2S) protein [Mariprofundaceae bacterium]
MQVVWVLMVQVTRGQVLVIEERGFALAEIHNSCWNAMMIEQERWQQIARPDEGAAVCFDFQARMFLPSGEVVELTEQGFLICFQGGLRAWRNHCPHVGAPLDWVPGQFFNDDGKLLLCHNHYALFEPLSGECVAGPCPRGLFPLPIKVLSEGVAVPLRVDL